MKTQQQRFKPATSKFSTVPLINHKATQNFSFPNLLFGRGFTSKILLFLSSHIAHKIASNVDFHTISSSHL